MSDVPVVEEYWDGILKRMQAEVDVFSRLVRHQGERGRENELAFVRLLEGLIPRRLGIGSGLLIDSTDRYSKQIDIVVYDQSREPTVLAQTTQLLFPVEQVRACVEVKTTLTAREIRDCGEKHASIRRLTSASDVAQRPAFVVLAYDAEASPQTVSRNFAELPSEDQPDLVLLLEPGLLLGRTGLLAGSSASFAAGIAFLHRRNTDGARLTGDYECPKEGEHDVAHVGSSLYPIADSAQGGARVGEPARALLLYCEALLRLLADVEGLPEPWLGRYLTAETKELDWVDLS